MGFLGEVAWGKNSFIHLDCLGAFRSSAFVGLILALEGPVSHPLASSSCFFGVHA
jgi:hypothetical protein